MRVKMDLFEAFEYSVTCVQRQILTTSSESTIALYRLLGERTTTRLLLKATSNDMPAEIFFLGGKVWHVSSEKNGSGLINITRTATNRDLLLVHWNFLCEAD